MPLFLTPSSAATCTLKPILQAFPHAFRKATLCVSLTVTFHLHPTCTGRAVNFSCYYTRLSLSLEMRCRAMSSSCFPARSWPQVYRHHTEFRGLLAELGPQALSCVLSLMSHIPFLLTLTKPCPTTTHAPSGQLHHRLLFHFCHRPFTFENHYLKTLLGFFFLIVYLQTEYRNP